MNKPTDFAINITKFFTFNLPSQRNLSPNTICSYADTFSLFLDFCESQQGIQTEKLTLEKVSMEVVEAFMHWIETERKNSPSTRRQRLAALHSFFRFMQKEEPKRIHEWQRILAIRLPKSPKPQPIHMRAEAMHELLSAPDLTTVQGRRDRALLCLLYDTGARVQELIDLSVRDIRISPPATVTLMGKGRKMRAVPIGNATTTVMEQYISEHHLNENGNATHPVFFNRQRNRLTRAGVSYVINKYLAHVNDEILPARITPHVFRHTKAMHLLQSGVDVILIKDILGHSDVSTTEIYAKADTEMKLRALQSHQTDTVPSTIPSWHTDSGLRTWLKGISYAK